MLAAVFAAATVVSAPLQADEMTRNVVMTVCLPFVAGENSRPAAEALGFVVTSEEGNVVSLVSSDEAQAYILRLTADDGADDGDVVHTCLLQARRINFGAGRGAIRRPLEEAGFVSERMREETRMLWTRGGVSVSLRQNTGQATVVRVSYSSVEAEGN